MSGDKNPLDEAIEQALDAFVYAPIGLVLDGPARFPKLVKNGRNQVTNARMMGQFAVQTGKAEVAKRAAATEGPLRDVLVGFGVVERPRPAPAPTPTTETETAPSEKPASKRGPSKKAPAKKAPSKKAPAKKAPAKKTPSKKAPAKRAPSKKTASKRAPSASALPIPDYDSLSASQVVSRLRGLSADQLRAVEVYESAKRARKTVLGRVAQLLDR